jgi:hypothetical protein
MSIFAKRPPSALEDCLRDEPEWRGLLRVEPIELEGSATLN